MSVYSLSDYIKEGCDNSIVQLLRHWRI